MEIGETFSPSSLSTIEDLGRHEVLERFVISDDVERFSKGKEERSPFNTGEDDGEHFFVMNVVVSFSR